MNRLLARVEAAALLAVLWGVTTTVRWLPVSFFPWAGRSLAALMLCFARKDLRRLRENVHRIYGLPPKTHFSRMFERQVFQHHALCLLETVRLIYEPERIEVSGFDTLQANVQKIEAEGKGVIVVTAHMGSWELCAHFGAKAMHSHFHVLAKPARRPHHTRILDNLRRRMGVSVMWTDRKSLVKDMLRALKSCQGVGFVMDQKPEGRKGPRVDFFGIPTEFVSGPASMAIRTGAGVISIFCVREGAFRYRLLSHEIVPANHTEADEVALTARMAAEIEQAIRLYPEQWAWNYKRWRFDKSAMPAGA